MSWTIFQLFSLLPQTLNSLMRSHPLLATVRNIYCRMLINDWGGANLFATKKDQNNDER